MDLESSGNHLFQVNYNGTFGSQGFNFDLRLIDTGANVVPNDSLPASLSLASFESAILGLDIFGDQETQASGPLRTLTLETAPEPVPEPATLTLLGGGLTIGAFSRARRRRRERS